MVVVFEIEAAGRRDGVQLVVGKLPSEDAPRSPARAVEPIAGIGHPVEIKDRPQAPLVEGRIVRHERKTLDTRGDVAPHLVEIRRRIGIRTRQPVDGRREAAVVVRARMDQPIDGIGDLAAPHDDHTHRADTRPLAVGRLEIYCCNILHGQFGSSGASLRRVFCCFSSAKIEISGIRRFAPRNKKAPPSRVGPVKSEGSGMTENQYCAFCGSNSVQPSVQLSVAEKAPM